MKLNITKCVSERVENRVAATIINVLKKNGFTYGNFERVIEKVKAFYENNATI